VHTDFLILRCEIAAVVYRRSGSRIVVVLRLRMP